MAFLIHLAIALFLVGVPVFGRPQGSASQPAAPSAPASNSDPIPIISQSDEVGGDGSFNFSFETANGIRVEQGGYVKKADIQARNSDPNSPDASENGDIQVIHGQYSYTAPDGQSIHLTYVADENGFQPQGEHLPTPPPLPETISKSLSQAPQESDQSHQQVEQAQQIQQR